MSFKLVLAAALLGGVAPAALSAQSASRAAARPMAAAPWRNTALPAADRARALVRAMTRAEKLRYVHGLFPPMTRERHADMIPSAGYVPGVPRLGIPTLRESDASLGVANQVEQRKGDTATALPASLATAASFDPAIAFAGGAMIGAEARAKTFNVLLAGGVNLTRDAWNGRNFEYLGEDPLLSGMMAAESIRGVQTNGIVSTVKHFALNAQETGRTILDARIDEKALRESDLLAFRIAIDGGRPGSVMCAYNKVGGDWACENRFLLTDVLRGEWGYPGFVMSDWGGVHSTEKAARAGLDQESGQELDKTIYFDAPLADAIAAGRVPAARLDEMVTRILTGVIASGLYDRPTPATAQPIDYTAHADVAQRAAEAGIVLLKNDADVLPFARTAKRIVLIGGHADVGVLSGGGSSQVRSVGGAPIEIPLTEGAAASFARVTYHASSPLRAIRAIAPNADVRYVDGRDPVAAAAAARDADIAIVFATQWQTEAQDAPSLSLPDGQDALIAAVAKANRKSVVVLETGGPVLMPWVDDIAGIVQAWYPGQRGGEAIARVLFGAVDASGRLPLSFPRAVAQLPRPQPVLPAGMTSLSDAASNTGSGDAAPPAYPVDYREGANVGYRWYAQRGERALFPFGYGLSYTRFRFADIRFTGGARPGASVAVTNTGSRAGVAVPQLYATGPDGTPLRLAGFRRIALAPGQTMRVELAADPRILARWTAGQGWAVTPGRYRLALATDATREVAASDVDVAGVVVAPH
ncbi:beta-glucosidase [Sphingomonas insulae]|uniref:Glycoside hydrolase family 3 protein n=1 Tax=Sphingomonas insulae TaxID=424800 RepID=A0ABN1HYC7_9SPHN|nr:beta-glucosidase [Sphingomonas insulae]NIJ29664.1 beta-glucosidase [Sphingomonas insulae]